MSWHEATPWERRRQKSAPVVGLEALGEIERKIRHGDVGISEALRLAFMVGFKTKQERRKAGK